MAKQRGIIKLEGTIGDITFQKTQDGYLAKEKSSIPASRIATDPAFQRTRENNAEFGRAGKAGKVLRNALRGALQKSSRWQNGKPPYPGDGACAAGRQDERTGPAQRD